jgi:hypothetical protein
MISFNKVLFAGAAALAVMAFDAGSASAQIHGYNSQFSNTPRYPTLGSYMFRNSGKPALPTFQAAPWYLYWPYDAHFMTPAPVNSPFYGPPVGGNFPVNPYFPAAAGSYGPMPGGPPPAGVPIPPAGVPIPPAGGFRP